MFQPCCAELLTEASRQAMVGMVTRIFSALGDLPPVTEVAATPRLQLAGTLPSAETPGQPEPGAETSWDLSSGRTWHTGDRRKQPQAAPVLLR